MSQVADPFAAAYDRLTAQRDPFAEAYDKIAGVRAERPDHTEEPDSLSPSAGALPQGGAPVSSSPAVPPSGTVPPEAYVGGGFRLPGGPMRAPTPRDPTLDELMDAQGVPNPTSSIERITGTAVSTGAQALGLAGSRWRDVLTGKRSLAEVVMLPDPAERGGGGSVPGLSAETVRGAGAAASQANTVERFVGGLAGMGPGFTDPKAIAAMIVTHAPTGAVLGSGPVQGMLAVTAKRFGEPVAAAAETILSSTAGLGAFSGTNAMLEGGDIGKATLEGAAQGAVLGGLMAPIAGVGAARGRTMPQDRQGAVRPTDTPEVPPAQPVEPTPAPKAPERGESDAVRTTQAEQAIAPRPPDAPILTRAARTGDIIHLAFDAAGPVPDPKAIKADLRAKGHEAEVVKFQTDFVSGANGLTEYRIDVRGGEEKAAAVYRDLTGGDEQIVNRSTFEGMGDLGQRMQATHAVMGEGLGLGKGKRPKEIASENVQARSELPPLRPQEGGPQGQTAQAGGPGVRQGGRAEPVPEAGEVGAKAAVRSPEKSYGDPAEAMGAAARGSGTVASTATPTPVLRQTFNALSGKTLPKTLAHSEDAANAVVRYASTKVYAPLEARNLDAQVRGEKFYKDEAFDSKLGTVLAEGQLRGLKADLNAAGKTAEAAKVRSLIGGPDSPLKTEADYQAALKDPEIVSAIDRHKRLVQPIAEQQHERLGGKLRSADPATGAFVNMQAVTGDESPMGTGAKGALTEPLRKSSRFTKAFSGTAAVYETRYSALLERMVKGNLSENLKRDAYDALVKNGLAIELPAGSRQPEIGGKPAVRLTIERKGVPRFEAGGELVGARTHTKDLWVRRDVYREVRNALDVDLDASQPWFARAINAVQLAAPTDAFFHSANWLMALAGQPRGKALVADMARQIPGVNVLEATARVMGKAHEVVADSPEIRKQLAEIASIGGGRSPHPEAEGGISRLAQKVNPFAMLGKGVMIGDQAARLVLDDIYKSAADSGLTTYSEAAHRDFINQVGQYNPRLMGKVQRDMRSIGLSPFVVAGRNFNRLAIQKLLQMPAYKAADTNARVRMLATTLTGTTLTLATPALWNFLKTGQAFPKGVPLGAFYGGKDSDGDTWYVDPLKWTGIRRGLRITGLDALGTGVRDHQAWDKVLGHIYHDVLGGALHPWAGPVVDAAVVATTGYGATGYRESPHAKKDQDQYVLNVKTALSHINPALGGMIDAGHRGAKTVPEAAWEYLKALGHAVGVGERRSPRGQVVVP